MSSSRWRPVALVVKVLVVALVLWALVDPDLAGLKSKGLTARAVGYPLGTLVLPALWWLGPRRRGRAYGWGADLLCGVPILLDLAGNRLDLYDTVPWWDDVMHLGLHALLTAGVLVQLLDETTPARWVVTAAAAVGGVSAIGWEVAEYLAFIRYGTELPWAYVDTLGDLALGTTGSLLAGAVLALLRRRPDHPQPRTLARERRFQARKVTISRKNAVGSGSPVTSRAGGSRCRGRSCRSG